MFQGIESLVPFITRSRLSLTLEDLVLVLKQPNPLSVELAPETQAKLAPLGEWASSIVDYECSLQSLFFQGFVQPSLITFLIVRLN